MAAARKTGRHRRQKAIEEDPHTEAIITGNARGHTALAQHAAGDDTPDGYTHAYAHLIAYG